MSSSPTPQPSASPDGGATPAAPRKRRGVFTRVLRLTGLALIAVLISGTIFVLARPVDAERAGIGIQRVWHKTLADFKVPLPGTPNLYDVERRLAFHGVKPGDPILIRIFKREFELELWMRRDGRFHRFATYPICKWSGELGPKLKTGDRQAPEGFYTVDQTQLNPNSAWHKSFNLGFPNAFDQSLKRTGSFLMVHGGCGSIGCYAMTNPVIDEIWRLVTTALASGQARFQVQVFPFRMTDANLARHAGSAQSPFWANLKQGYDLFEAGQIPPKVSVCSGKYAFAAGTEGYDGSGIIAAGCP